jgi:hypothetical protein
VTFIGDRPDVWMKVRIKTPYVCSRSGAVIHKVKRGSSRHRALFSTWRSRQVAYSVDLQCRFPSIIRDAIPLLNTDDRMPPGRNYYESLKPLQLCRHCFPGGE